MNQTNLFHLTSLYNHEIKNQTGSDIQFYPDGNQNQGAREDQEKELRYKYLKFYHRNVFYLPAKTPEEVIWNQEFAESLLTVLNKVEYIQRVQDSQSHKEKFLLLAEAMTGEPKNVDVAEKTFLEKWLTLKNEGYIEIVGLISIIKALPKNI